MLETSLFGAICTCLLALIAIPAFRPAAQRIGLVDHPGERRRHLKATPVVGGLSILLAVVPIGLWLLPLTPQLKGLGLAAVVLMIAGVADDIMRLRWPYRLGGQVLAALVMIYVGGIQIDNVGEIFGYPTRPLGPLAVPLTVIATVGLINAFNMIDGVDGLAGTVGLVAILLLAVAAHEANNGRLETGLMLVAGALCGFLAYNLRTPWNPRALVFLGNAGSELLGLVIACATFRLTQNGSHPVGVEIAPFLVAVPLIDCLTLILRRLRLKVSPFHGDRNHVHHMLLDAGFTPTAVVAVMAMVALGIGALAMLAMSLETPPIMFTVAFLALWAIYLVFSRRRDKTVERLSRVATVLRRPFERLVRPQSAP